jgi:hypothetical protein
MPEVLTRPRNGPRTNQPLSSWDRHSGKGLQRPVGRSTPATPATSGRRLVRRRQGPVGSSRGWLNLLGLRQICRNPGPSRPSSGGKLSAESATHPDRIPWGGCKSGEDGEALAFVGELSGEVLPFAVDALGSVAFVGEPLQRGKVRCCHGGCILADLGELAVCFGNGCNVLPNDCRECVGAVVTGNARCCVLRWGAVVDPSIGSAETLDGALFHAPTNGAFGDSETSGEAGDGLPLGCVIDGAIVQDFGGRVHGRAFHCR